MYNVIKLKTPQSQYGDFSIGQRLEEFFLLVIKAVKG